MKSATFVSEAVYDSRTDDTKHRPEQRRITVGVIQDRDRIGFSVCKGAFNPERHSALCCYAEAVVDEALHNAVALASSRPFPCDEICHQLLVPCSFKKFANFVRGCIEKIDERLHGCRPFSPSPYVGVISVVQFNQALGERVSFMPNHGVRPSRKLAYLKCSFNDSAGMKVGCE